MLELTEAAAQHLGGVLRAAPQLPSEGPAQAECAQLDRRYLGRLFATLSGYRAPASVSGAKLHATMKLNDKSRE